MSIRRVVIEKTSSNEKRLQTVQVSGLPGEILDNVEHYQQYGFSSVPVTKDSDGKGSEGLMVDVNGSTLKSVIATDDRRYRPRTGEEGDVILYHKNDDPEAEHDDATARMVITDDGDPYTTRFKIIIGSAYIEIVNSDDITLHTANGATVHLDGTKISLFALGQITVDSWSSVAVTAPTVTVNASSSVTISSPTINTG